MEICGGAARVPWVKDEIRVSESHHTYPNYSYDVTRRRRKIRLNLLKQKPPCHCMFFQGLWARACCAFRPCMSARRLQMHLRRLQNNNNIWGAQGYAKLHRKKKMFFWASKLHLAPSQPALRRDPGGNYWELFLTLPSSLSSPSHQSRMFLLAQYKNFMQQYVFLSL